MRIVPQHATCAPPTIRVRRGALEVVPKGGDGTMTLDGKYLAKFARESDGSWKWSRFAYNWDAPVGG